MKAMSIAATVYQGYYQLWNGDVVRMYADREDLTGPFLVSTLEMCDSPVRLSNKEEKWFPVQQLDLKALAGPSVGCRASHRR